MASSLFSSETMDSIHDSISAVNSAAANGNSVPPFLSKTYDMVDDSSTNSVLSWSNSGNSFVVWSVPEFARDLLPKYFKHSNFSSFVRQLNTYGFRKVDPDRWEFANEGFLRGQKHLLKSIVRRKPAHGHNHQPEVHSSSVGACVEVGKFGIEEEFERLKRDKNVLMQELVRLRQQQQNTEHQLQNVGQKVQVMEQRQQQMMSFLAKAMRSPGFLNQLVQQGEGNRRIAAGNKKRRLPRQDKENSSGHGVNCPNGQIIKYQPSINEAAKAMLHQILKLNASARLESSVNNPGSFLINDIPSSSVLENESSSNGVSGVTLSEVPPISAQSYMSAESRFPASCIPTSVSELHSSPHMVADPLKAGKIPEMNVHHSRDDRVLPNSTQMQENMLGTTIGAPDTNFMVSEAGNAEYMMDRISAELDGTDAIETDFVFQEHDLAMFLDGASQLPGINDAFWEQFLAASPLPVGTDEISSSSSESVTMKYQFQSSEGGWDKIQHINNLTDKMSLLTSESKKG